MRRHFSRWLLASSVVLHAPAVLAVSGEFSFGVIAHPFRSAPDESILREAIADTDVDNLAFVVANGVKAASEPCTDGIYSRRKTLLESAKNGLIVSPAASDWVDCKTEAGKPAAIGRLNRLRELFFNDEFSIGASRIPLVRQSASAKFRSYAENSRWEFGRIMFATINLPEDNNHYRPEAGRNAEFEDRLIANRDWLHRNFVHATRKKLDAIVLFCDANPLSTAKRSGVRRDGFTEIRQQIIVLAAKFPGKVLIIHGRKGTGATGTDAMKTIAWQGNIGILEVTPPWIKLNVDPSRPRLFEVVDETVETRAASSSGAR
jgi:hypothetical protein